ncbi:threonylcarbamoyl-AMP synthase [Dissulfurirhabdus thermomarina]|uniref:Threonylcarbamoyl-AMP synthase n=1 Tax=Dissulfurirhabdus thermomarina TaxID=1765737 RepID=A0A6N9TPC8_DISTH|nr:L-threonylcarbamoyladenylate synthase [Dissulfurirhabdus thermomarina]NDY43132.1 threonylcarbamoyl-AMP synthase [Dissulfurirhabdus thermomarina]NMX23571.1 threonylcarbamoyl-AMP synthase [Dissulfurirhabdus thermomarina]
MRIEIDPERPRPRAVQQVVRALEAGGVVVYPTDTCYGLGADIFNKKAIERIYRLKGVPKTEPFSFVCADLREISRYARVTDLAYRILRRMLPGPYTFVLEGSRQVPKMMLTKRRTVGIRVPDHPICQAIAAALGRPLISTSATLAGSPIFEDPREAAEAYGKNVDIVVDSGLILPEPSSVVSLIGDEPEVLRAGKGDVSLFEAAGA